MKKWVCSVCGYVHEGETAPAECPICHVGADKFRAQEGEQKLADEHVLGIAKGVDEALLYQRKPITLTECEKTFGKKDFAELFGSHVIKPPGKPALVEDSDPRAPFNPAASDFAELETN